MKRWLIRAGYLPFPLYIVPIFVAGFFYPGYDHISQHASVLGQPDSPVYPYYNWPATALGLSMVLFALGFALHLVEHRRPFVASLLILALSGVSFATNGIFPMGTPLHGLYGLAVFSLIAPLLAINDAGDRLTRPWLRLATAVISIASVGYLWLMLTGNDPEGYRGATQRVFGSTAYLWYGLAAATFANSQSRE